MNNSINNLSPLDGRYSKKVSEITELFSEKALIQKRFIIEIEWLLFVLNESFKVTFDEEIRGVAPGQSAVFYNDNLCLGGGIIEARNNDL